MLMTVPRLLILSLQLQMSMFFFPSCFVVMRHAVHSKKKAVAFHWGLDGETFLILLQTLQDTQRLKLFINLFQN